ncbi:MAG: prolipoprotein diacylglyceryl transferase, partial [Spirochaetia bacterium]|nr:prolipoprotein diacylglyceryl transferase [Spirochaetia bacterium]
YSMVNLPRHPSQLYEAFLEGIVLFTVIWFVHKHKKWDGMLGSIYMGGYGLVRFIIEYFREPDADIGYRIAKDSSAPIYQNTSLLNFSTGQILCFLMIVGAIILAISTKIYYNRKDKLSA